MFKDILAAPQKQGGACEGQKDMDDETRKRFDAIDRQLQAIVTRLDEQDAGHDRLMGKVDRLAVLARAGEEAMTSIDALSRRVARVEAAQRGGNE